MAQVNKKLKPSKETKAARNAKNLEIAKAAGVPFPNPQNNAEKEANAIARNKRKEERRIAKEAERVAALTPEELAAEQVVKDALNAKVAAMKPAAPAVDEDKPVVSYDTDDKPSENVPGVAVVANDATDTTMTYGETETIVLSDVGTPNSKETVITVKKPTRAQRRAAQAAARHAKLKPAETETRNGDAPTASSEEEEVHVDDDLAAAGSFEKLAEAEKAAEVAAEPIAEHDAGSAVDVAEAVPGVTDPVADSNGAVDSQPITGTDGVADPVADVAQPAADIPVKNEPKQTLTLVSNNSEDPKVIAAKAFYGDAFTPERQKLLSEALFWLNKAIQYEGTESMAKQSNMALNTALKKEAEAFNMVAMAKAA